MADPFSIASGTVGIISLGIQLCKGITTYVDSWRGYDADLESIGLKAESLKEPLKQLRDFVEDTRVTDPNTANDITDKASELKRHLTRLEKRLTQAKPVISDSLTDKFRNKLKKAAYPVRARDALRDIKNDLDSVQSIIEFALTIFTAKRTQKASQSTERTLKLVEEIHVTLSTIPQNIMLPPSVLKSLCDRCDERANPVDLNSQFNFTTQGDDFDLDVDARLSSMMLSTKRARREDSTKRLFRYYSGWLARQITLSFSLSYAAGAFSIAPVLEVRAYRGPGSWVDNAVPDIRLLKIAEIQDPDSRQESENELISDFQQAISTGEFGPGDLHGSGLSVVEWIVYLVNTTGGVRTGKLEHGLRLTKFLRFMIECGYNLKLDNPGYMMFMILNFEWGANDEIFALYLINHGTIVKCLPWTRHGKENIRRLLHRDTELVDLPEIVKIILLESELELREALQSEKTNLLNRHIGPLLLLELAVGWPGGVHVLLEFGAEASEVNLSKCPYKTDETDDSDCDDYCDSIMPLLQGGCSLEARDIYVCKSKKARLLLINEYANRRKTLLDMARRCLPPGRLAEILGHSSYESILDAHVPQICTEIINNGGPVHRSIPCELKNYQPLYHECYGLDVWDDLYRAGFRDIDSSNSEGLTPLMSCALRWGFQGDHLAWLVDKGASMSKRLPFSNTTIAHRVSSQFADDLVYAIMPDNPSGKIPHRSLDWLEWAKNVLIPSAQDRCVCACCDGGCTTLSVALRGCNRTVEHLSSLGSLRAEYFWLLNSLIDLAETTIERDHSIIRFLTFEALGLRHTCCVGIDNHFWPPYKYSFMDPEEAQNIQDEDKNRYKQFDKLVGNLETWFDELELPIMEFLSGPWHSHMVEILSTRDSYDEEHVEQSRDLGIFLEPVDFDEIPEFVYYLGHQVEELISEGSVSAVADGDGDDSDYGAV